MRLLVVDDSPLFRSLIRHFVEDSEELEIVGEAAGAEQGLEAVGEHNPDVVVVDWSLPGRDGVWATSRIKERYPDVDVLALTSANDPDVAESFTRAGATAMFDKAEMDVLVDWLTARAAEQP